MADNRIDTLAGTTGNMGADPFARLLGFNTYRDRLGGLDQQRAQAQALRNRPKRKYSTWAGALAGGVGDVLDQVNAGLTERELRDEEKALIGSEDERTNALLNLPGMRERILGGLSLGGPTPAAAASAPPPLGPMHGPMGPPIPYPRAAMALEPQEDFVTAPEMMPMDTAPFAPMQQQMRAAEALRQRPPVLSIGAAQRIDNPTEADMQRYDAEKMVRDSEVEKILRQASGWSKPRR